jgi:hypothetical protein
LRSPRLKPRETAGAGAESWPNSDIRSVRRGGDPEGEEESTPKMDM